MMQKNMHKKSAKNASSDVFGNFFGGESSRARGRGVPGSCPRVSVRSPKLSFTEKKKKSRKSQPVKSEPDPEITACEIRKRAGNHSL